MTREVIWQLRCDEPNCYRAYPIRSRTDDARESAARQGWTNTRENRHRLDWCPDHRRKENDNG